MNAVRPRGPLPARVYWVRRAVVLGIPLLVVVVVVWLVAGRGSDDGTSGAEPSASVTSEAPAAAEGEQPADESTAGVTACPAESLAVTITATGPSFPEGTDPTFDLTITNNGTVPCLVDAGTSQSEVVIVSGSDRIWSSRDCAAADAVNQQLLIDSGKSHQQQLAWDRTRSVEGCAPGQPEPNPGTYSATLTVQGAASQPTVFGLE